jgi:uncharacterized membrane protein YgcG
MIKIKFIPMIALIISAAFLLGSTPAFSQIEDDYHQKQNKIIDPNERNTEQLNLDQSGSSSQQQSGQQSGSSQQGGGMSGGQSSGGQGMDQGQSSDTDKKKGY